MKFPFSLWASNIMIGKTKMYITASSFLLFQHTYIILYTSLVLFVDLNTTTFAFLLWRKQGFSNCRCSVNSTTKIFLSLCVLGYTMFCHSSLGKVEVFCRLSWLILDAAPKRSGIGIIRENINNTVETCLFFLEKINLWNFDFSIFLNFDRCG